MSAVLVLNVLWQVGVLAAVALGLAVVFGQLRIMNMAHGEFVMIGAYAPVITAAAGLPAWCQLPVCLASVAVVALVLERTVVRHFYGRLFDSLLATWGVSIVLREGVALVFGRGYQSVPLPIGGTVSVFGADYPAYRLAALAAVGFFFVGFAVWMVRSPVAMHLRAMVENPDLARGIGLDTDRLACNAFVFGCCTAGLAGLMLAPTVPVEPLMGLDYLIRAFFALVIGGLGSLEGLAVGATVIAGTQSVVGGVFDQTAGYFVVLGLSVYFLWWRPDGLCAPGRRRARRRAARRS
ncbi:MAG: branched-chain amino acid ABC transporter permease [Pseudomonadota bacterium]